MFSGSVSGMLFGLLRRSAILKYGVLGLSIITTVLLSSSSPAEAATLLFPNLKTLPPRDLRFDRADVDPDGGGIMHDVLRFTNTVWDAGPGRLEMRGTIDPKTNSGAAMQRVYDGSGGHTDFTAGAFYYHPAHHHYHYDNWGRYELWTKPAYEAWLASGRTEGNPMVGSKTTSCMMDEEFIRSVPNQPYPPAYATEGCFPDSEGHMLQGISPGWGDTYDYFRFEQWIDLGASGSLADGAYVLRSVTDPLNKIYESPDKADTSRESQEDNEAITEFGVHEGKLVDFNPPSGSVRINDVDASTSSPNVIVKVLGRDDVSGVREVRLSNDDSSWSAWQSYTGQESIAKAIDWSLTDPAYGGTSSDGTKTVYAEFRDWSGRLSAPETDTIVLDRSGDSSPYSNAVLNDSPAGYWRLGETSGTTASDAAGANLGTFRSGPVLGQPSLLPADTANRSVRFDGGNECVQVPSSSSLSPAASVSVEAWIKPATLPGPGEFASVASKPGSYSLQFDGPRLEFTIIQGGTYRRLQAPIGAIEPGHVHYVVGTYDGARQDLYVDGSEVAGGPLTGAISTASDAELSIGCWNEGREQFHGTIDEVAVYPAPLSAARVVAHYQAGLAGEPPSTTLNPPSDLTAAAASDTSVELHWVDNSDNEGEFRVERDTSPSFSSPVVQATWADSTSFTDIDLSPGTTYYYRIRARNATDSSGYSNVASAVTLPPPDELPSSRPMPGSSNPHASALHYELPSPASLSPRAGGYAAAVMGDHPFSYWQLDEASGTSAIDARMRNPAIYRDDPELGGPGLLAAERDDRAVRFNRGGDYAEVPSLNSPGQRAGISIEAWIAPATLPSPGSLAVVAGKAGSYWIGLDGDRLVFAIARPQGVGQLRTRAGPIVAGRAFHVVGTYDGKTQRLFVNGVEVETARLSGPIAAGTRSFDIGSAGGSGGQFAGEIDEVALYSRALPAARVRAHYRAGTWHRPRI